MVENQSDFNQNVKNFSEGISTLDDSGYTETNDDQSNILVQPEEHNLVALAKSELVGEQIS